jgi:electron transfer flavoprotein beta subunit
LSLDVVVLVKYVPNPSGLPPEIGPDFRLRREDPNGGLDPSDEPGVDVAVRLVEELGGTVTAVSLGPEPALRAVWRALALGADCAVLVSDGALAGADALATARALAAAIARRPFDLVLAGVESTDGATGTMPVALAELLGLPSATFARRVRVEAERVAIERQTSSGYDEIECELPALVTVTAGAGGGRYPSVKDTIRAKKKPVERLSLADLGLDADVHASQEVTAVEIAPYKQAGELIEDEAEAPARIARFLAEAGAIQP